MPLPVSPSKKQPMLALTSRETEVAHLVGKGCPTLRSRPSCSSAVRPWSITWATSTRSAACQDGGNCGVWSRNGTSRPRWVAETKRMREFVTDVEDPRLADYARLTDMELRTSLESAQGLFIAEGTKVISRAVAAGYPVRSVLLAERRLGDLLALPATGTPVYVIADETAERLTGYRVHRGALASFHRKPLPQTAALAAPPAGSSSSRTSSTTPTSGPSSGAPPRSAWTLCSCHRGAPTRSTGGR